MTCGWPGAGGGIVAIVVADGGGGVVTAAVVDAGEGCRLWWN
jgi:hypothetical protein